MKKACVFFKRLRLTYPLLIGLGLLQEVRDFDLILFALAFTFLGCFGDILTDTIWTADRVEELRRGGKKKCLRE